MGQSELQTGLSLWGKVMTNMCRPAERVVALYDKRRTCESQIDAVIAEFGTNKMETYFFTRARPARSLRDVDNTIASV
jgi:hypothetical protein